MVGFFNPHPFFPCSFIFLSLFVVWAMANGARSKTFQEGSSSWPKINAAHANNRASDFSFKHAKSLSRGDGAVLEQLEAIDAKRLNDGSPCSIANASNDQKKRPSTQKCQSNKKPPEAHIWASK